MGCASSVGRKKERKRRSEVPVVGVFVPSLRVPVAVDLGEALGGLVSREVLERLAGLRGRIVALSERNVQERLVELRGEIVALPERNVLSVVPELRGAVEEYLPVLLGLTKKEFRFEGLVEFKWKNLEGDNQDIGFASAWYEVMSVVHLMAMLSLLEANMLLVPMGSADTCAENIAEESKKDAIDLLLQASGYLDYCIHNIIVHLPLRIRQSLPYDMQEGALETISTQALGQGVEIQLGLAAEYDKVTLSVKRRLACEEVSYFAQAYYCLSECATDGFFGKKHMLFIKWKYLEAKVAAYYYHGQLLDRSNGPKDRISAVNCFLAADELLMDSKKSCLNFCLAAPVTRMPPAWGVMKHLNQKVAEAASEKYQMYGYLFEQEGYLQSLPELPEFTLSLKPEDYELPDIDESWDDERCQPVAQSLRKHLED